MRDSFSKNSSFSTSLNSEHHLPAVEQEVDGIILTPWTGVRTGTHETCSSGSRDKNTVDFRMERDGDTWRLYVQSRNL